MYSGYAELSLDITNMEGLLTLSTTECTRSDSLPGMIDKFGLLGPDDFV